LQNYSIIFKPAGNWNVPGHYWNLCIIGSLHVSKRIHKTKSRKVCYTFGLIRTRDT